jgi:5-methylcytosine-specific restriction endonuclease McrA
VAAEGGVVIQKPTPKFKQRKPLRSHAHLIPDSVRLAVYIRDEYLCQSCRIPGGRLDPHHILPRSRGGSDTLDNLVSLHRLCHDQVHLHPSESKKAGLLA